MNYHRPTRLAQLAVLCFMTLVSLVTLAATARAQISLSSLKGRWAMSLVGFTGCGQSSMYVTFTLDRSGSGKATTQFHGQCGDSTETNLPFAIQSLNPD